MQLTEQHKKLLDKFVEDIYICVEDLESAHWVDNIYGVEPQYAVRGWEYDDDEYFDKQLSEAIEIIEYDGVEDCFGILEEDQALKDAAIEYLKNKIK